MKKGVLVYSALGGNVNIGDYIQSLAALQYMGDGVDYYINREQLDEFNEENVKLIMNGWFTHEPNHWPPSSFISPLFVSFHINSLSKKQLLSEAGLNYFKLHEPIGCRDLDTTQLLKEKGINAFFSGCLTLTLGKKYTSDKRTEKIYFVDAFSSSNKNLHTLFVFVYILITKLTLIIKLAKKQFKNLSFYSLRKTLSFYREYSKHFTDEILIRAEYITHEIPENVFSTEQQKFEYAKELLHKYAKAKLIVTSKIHCALPCLGLQTPVIYVDNAQQDESSYCRLNGLRELFNIVVSDKGELKFKFEKRCDKIGTSYLLENKSEYRVIKQKLIDICELFVNNPDKK